MQGNYRLMEDGSHIGTFMIDSEAGIWKYTPAALIDIQPLVFKLALRDLDDETLNGDVVQNWITNRAPEPNYEFIDALMEKVGITEYDPLAFVEYNGGRFNTDSFYLEKRESNP